MLVSQWLANVERRTQSAEQPDSEHTDPVLRSTFYALRSARLSLDEDDSDLGRCWRYLVAAIRHAYPDSCPETVALLDSPQLPPPRYLADELANELADLPGRLILVLDDCHHIISGQTVHEALRRLIAHLPHNVQFVVTSRVDLPWSLGRLRAQGQVAELRAADLRFTEDEVRSLLGGVVSGEQLAPAAAQLFARTEGWAVGLQLARMSLRIAPDVAPVIAGLRGTSRYIADYLLDEVLGRQPEALQRSLLILAVPERFCQDLYVSLLDDMPGGAGPAPIAELERQGLFLTALDDTRVWYRLHQLVRDLLAARLVETVGQETVAALHRRCSAWFAAHAQIDEAIRHALLAGDEELAARITERGYRALLERNDDMVKLGPLLALLPEPIVQGRPMLLLAHALNAYICWDLPAVRRLTELAQIGIEAQRSTIDADTLTELCGEAALLQSFLSFVSGDGAQTLALARQAYQAVPHTRPFLHALAVRFHAVALQMSGDYEGGYQLIVHHRGQHVHQGSKARASLVTSCCLLDYLDANLERLAGDVQLLIGESTWSRTYHLAFGHYIRGRLHYERNELEQARQAFTQASSVPLSAVPLMHHDCLAGLAYIALAQGEREQADAYARLARAYAGERPSQTLTEANSSLEAALALSRDDLAGAGS
jgi:LuxR family maltose regulon positive regulatory protein